jgi:NiFe hydrogenase small subunit HydA
MEAVQEYSRRASGIVCVGTCASFGGIPASGSNPTGAVSVSRITGRKTINISGCPANPDWIVWTLVQLILGNPIELDADSRPKRLYDRSIDGAPEEPIIHNKCPRNVNVNPNALPEATSFGQDRRCLIRLGCRGPRTKARCRNCWNGLAGSAHYCIGVNAPCHGCVEPTFPGPESFYERYNP